MKQRLLAWGYRKSLIDSGISKATSIVQDTLRQNTASKKTHNWITFVQKYNPNNPPVWSKIKDTLQLLENSNRNPAVSRQQDLWSVERPTFAVFVNNTESKIIHGSGPTPALIVHRIHS